MGDFSVADTKKKPGKAIENRPAKAKKRSFRLFQYFKEVVAELKKLTWPTKNELVSHTGAVFMFLIAMAILIGVLDLVFSQGISLLARIGA